MESNRSDPLGHTSLDSQTDSKSANNVHVYSHSCSAAFSQLRPITTKDSSGILSQSRRHQQKGHVSSLYSFWAILRHLTRFVIMTAGRGTRSECTTRRNIGILGPLAHRPISPEADDPTKGAHSSLKSTNLPKRDESYIRQHLCLLLVIRASFTESRPPNPSQRQHASTPAILTML